MNIEPILTQFRRDVREAFRLPPKSELRLRCEAEWSDAANHAAKALNSSALGFIDSVRLLLSVFDGICVRAHGFFHGGSK